MSKVLPFHPARARSIPSHSFSLKSPAPSIASPATSTPTHTFSEKLQLLKLNRPHLARVLEAGVDAVLRAEGLL